MTRTDTVRRWVFAGAAVAAIGFVAVCCSMSEPQPPTAGGRPTASASPSGSGVVSSGTTAASPSASVDPSVGEATTAYRGYWAARVKAQAASDQPVPPELDTYAIDTARTDVKASVLRFRQQGIAFRGQPVLSPVVSVAGSGEDGTASIADCVDSTNWTPVFVATGSSALAPGQPLRVVVESTARRYAGRWVIASSVAHRDRSC